jgi:hypothetical protein
MYESKFVNFEKRDRKIGEAIKKPNYIVEFNKYMKGVSRGDHFCGLVVRVYGYRSRVPRFDSWRFQIF